MTAGTTRAAVGPGDSPSPSVLRSPGTAVTRPVEGRAARAGSVRLGDRDGDGAPRTQGGRRHARRAAACGVPGERTASSPQGPRPGQPTAPAGRGGRTRHYFPSARLYLCSGFRPPCFPSRRRQLLSRARAWPRGVPRDITTPPRRASWQPRRRMREAPSPGCGSAPPRARAGGRAPSLPAPPSGKPPPRENMARVRTWHRQQGAVCPHGDPKRAERLRPDIGPQLPGVKSRRPARPRRRVPCPGR